MFLNHFDSGTFPLNSHPALPHFLLSHVSSQQTGLMCATLDRNRNRPVLMYGMVSTPVKYHEALQTLFTLYYNFFVFTLKEYYIQCKVAFKNSSLDEKNLGENKQIWQIQNTFSDFSATRFFVVCSHLIFCCFLQSVNQFL